MAFPIEDADLQARLEKVILDHNADLSGDVATVITKRRTFAYNIILRVLIARGYTKAQIDSEWAHGEEYQLDIATYWSLIDMGLRKGDEEEWIEVYNRQEELEDIILLTSAGIVIDPSGASEIVFELIDLEEANDALGINTGT